MLLELIKIGNDGNRISKIKEENPITMQVGGREGIKRLVDIFLLGRGGKERSVGRYVVKEYNRDEEDIVRGIVRSYKILKKDGFLVPNIVRYYISDKGRKIQLLMSDMTNNGSLLLWGPSDEMDLYRDYETLKNMNLTELNIEKIRVKVQKIAETAVEKSVRLFFYNFHLMKDKKTGEFNICLLDVRPGIKTYDTPANIKKLNDSAVRLFISHLYTGAITT